MVRLSPGDWLELRLTHQRPGFDWEIVDQPGCLVPICEPRPERPTVLPRSPRFRTLGFLAFAADRGAVHPLRLALAHPKRPGPAEVRELSVVVG